MYFIQAASTCTEIIMQDYKNELQQRQYCAIPRRNLNLTKRILWFGKLKRNFTYRQLNIIMARY